MRQERLGGQEDLASRLASTERRAEELGRELKTLVENIPGRRYRADAKWTLELFNSEQDLFGYSQAELNEIGAWPSLVYARDREDAWRQWQLLIEAPRSLVQIYRMIEKTGEVRWVEDRKTSVFSIQGEFQHVDGVIQDIHDRKRAEEMLEQTNQMARVGGWELDFTSGRLLWSDVTREIHEVPADFVPELETAISFYKEGESRDKISAAVGRAVEEGVPYDVELQLITHKGREIWVRAIGQAELVDGTCVRCFGTFQDIDQRKKYEEELARARETADLANRAKSDFLANMSHEIRTPMNAILGLAELVRKSDLTPRQEDYMAKLHSSSQALLTILNDILDLSKIEANQLILHRRQCPVDEVVGRVSGLFGALAIGNGVELHFAVAEQVPKVILGDIDRISQVLNNLVGNAIKFTEQGEIAVDIDVAERQGNELMLRFRISDTGIGISADRIPALFEPFVQADVSRSRRFGGTGLGLSICKRLVELMGGAIEVTSELGVGSEFVFTVGCRAVDEDDEIHAMTSIGPLDPVAKAASLEGARILLVEDNELNRLVACAFIEQAGLTVDAVNDGLAAIEQIQRASYDAVLMDVQMPGMDGYEATRRIHALPGLESLPVIAVSASVMAADRKACLEAGMIEFLSKPLSSDRLIEVLSSCLEDGR